MSMVTDLQEARELILNEDRWTQEAYARDINDEVAPATSDKACKWCALGALRVVSGFDPQAGRQPPKNGDRFYDLEALLCRAAEKIEEGQYGTGPVGINDYIGHKATLKLYDKAIALAKGQE